MLEFDAVPSIRNREDRETQEQFHNRQSRCLRRMLLPESFDMNVPYLSPSRRPVVPWDMQGPDVSLCWALKPTAVLNSLRETQMSD